MRKTLSALSLAVIGTLALVLPDNSRLYFVDNPFYPFPHHHTRLQAGPNRRCNALPHPHFDGYDSEPPTPTVAPAPTAIPEPTPHRLPRLQRRPAPLQVGARGEAGKRQPGIGRPAESYTLGRRWRLTPSASRNCWLICTPTDSGSCTGLKRVITAAEVILIHSYSRWPSTTTSRTPRPHSFIARSAPDV